jgi:hypothetical protein
MLGGGSRDRRLSGEPCRPALVRRAQRTERHEGDLALLAIRKQVVLLTIDDAVRVLDPGDVDELRAALQRRSIDIGEPDQIDLPLAAELVERAELILEPTFVTSQRPCG